MNNIKIILSGILLIPIILSVPHLESKATSSCNDVIFIFARGSGESLNDINYQEYKNKIETIVSGSSLKYGFYELGSNAQNGYQYPAAAIGIDTVEKSLTSIGAVISAGTSYAFGKSVKNGERELEEYISTTSASCKETKYVIAGYSQGGLVVSNAIKNLNSSKIIYAATFGDPKLYLPEGYGINPDACHGKNISNYRAYVPNCRAYEGILGQNNPYQTTEYLNKLGVWCNYKDIMCSKYFSIPDPFEGHVSYISDGLYDKLAKIIENKLIETFPDKISTINYIASTHDVAILIDSTGSMSGLIKDYKAEALKLAKETIKTGGRIALYEYRDLSDPFETVQHCSFETCTIDIFKQKLNSITTGGGGDTPESTLSALLKIMNTEKWKAGVTKSTVILTDAGYHPIEIDGATLDQVVKRSLEIDPVNCYIITKPNNINNYAELAKLTGGKAFSSVDEMSLSTIYITERPVANLNNTEYVGLTGDEMYFDASPSSSASKIVSYEWDLDCDGIFETKTELPYISKSYLAPIEGFIQVKITDENGLSSTMSASILINDIPNDNDDTIEIINVDNEGNSSTIDCTSSADKVLLIINDAIMGELSETHITITDLDLAQENLISFIPLSNDGKRGETKIVSIGKIEYSSDNSNVPLESHKTIKAPDSGIVKKTTSNSSANDRQTHIYKRQDF